MLLRNPNLLNFGFSTKFSSKCCGQIASATQLAVESRFRKKQVNELFFLILLCYLAVVVGDNKSTATNYAGESMAISIAIAMQRYNVGCISRWSTSGASLEATGCHHHSSACVVSPRQPPWSKNLNQMHKTLTNHNF